MGALLDDIEAEITYLRIRDSRPATVVEISPCDGWSTVWILSALRDNRRGRLHSFDIHDTSLRYVPGGLKSGRWKFTRGDVRRNLRFVPDAIDYLFIDADHSAAFCRWYVASVFPKVSAGGYVSVHDVFHYPEEAWGFGEPTVILRWLARRNISYLTASPTVRAGISVYSDIQAFRSINGLALPKPSPERHLCNPMIFFRLPTPPNPRGTRLILDLALRLSPRWMG